MLFPVRCFSCNKVIGNKIDLYEKLQNQMDNNYIFEHLGIKRYCCKRMFLGHIDDKIDIIDNLLKHEQHFDYLEIL